MGTLLQDLRYGLRMLAKNPGFTAVAVLTLALGIGVNTTVFSVADGILFHPLPFVHDSSQVVGIVQITKDSNWHAVIEPANFLDLQKQSQSFSTMAAYEWTSATLAGPSQADRGEPGAERVDGVRVSEDFFETLVSRAALGRIFLPEENQSGHAVVILSNRLWRSHFAANPEILGRTIRMDGQSFTVIGVMPSGFNFPTGAALWVPLALSPEDWANRKSGHLHVIARLRPKVAFAQARSELAAISGRLARAYPETNEGQTAVPVLVGEMVNGNLTPMFCYTLLGAVAFLLLIACANVANLQLARATSRWREIALRSALGAGRWRMVQQLLTETALLSALGAGLGLLFAQGGIGLIVSSMPAETAEQIAGWGDIGLNGRAFVFAMVVTILSALLSGLVPALRGSNIELSQSLKSSGPTSSPSTLRLRSLLVSAEIALALLLVVGAGLMVKGFLGTLEKARSFGPANFVTARVLLPEYKYRDIDKRRVYFDRAYESLEATPGVSAACLFTTPPFSNNGTQWRNYTVQGVPSGERLPAAIIQAVSGKYFQVMSIPILAGRAFEARDSATALPVAVVNQKLARLYWPEVSGLGKQVRFVHGDSIGPWLTVVGVAGDVEYDWTDNEPEKAIYIPFSQIWSSLDPKGRDEWVGTYFGARTSVEPESLVPTLRRELAGVDPDVPSFGWETLDKVMTASLAGIAEVGGVVTGAGLMALILAAVGIYGVSAFSVEQRTREIGIRMALGAKRQNILMLVLKRGSVLIAAGFAAGMAGVLALMPLLSAFFYGVRPTDPPTLLSVSLLLASVAVLAIYMPARRAAKVDPMVALRYE